MPFQADLFALLVNACIPLVLLVGAARLARLFLSPVPRPAPVAVQRRGWLSAGTMGPTLTFAGCVVLGICIAAILHLRSLPPGLWNIVPLVAAWLTTIVSGFLLLAGIVVQSILVDANRGLQEQDWGASTASNLDGLLLMGLGVALAAAAGFQWMKDFDIAQAAMADIEQRELIIRLLFGWALAVAGIRVYERSSDKQAPQQARTPKWVSYLLWPMMFVAFGWILKGLLPSDIQVRHFAANRDEEWFKLRPDHLLVPLELWRGSLLALPGIALAAIVSARIVGRWFMPRGTRPPATVWPALLSCAAFLLLAVFLAHQYLRQHPMPGGDGFDVWVEFTLPLILGMASVPLIGPAWRLLVRATSVINRMSGENLFFQIVLWTPAAAIVVGLLYGASLLSVLSYALAVLGWASAMANGLPALLAPKDDLQAVRQETT